MVEFVTFLYIISRSKRPTYEAILMKFSILFRLLPRAQKQLLSLESPFSKTDQYQHQHQVKKPGVHI
jgi:hypothetical protein